MKENGEFSAVSRRRWLQTFLYGLGAGLVIRSSVPWLRDPCRFVLVRSHNPVVDDSVLDRIAR